MKKVTVLVSFITSKKGILVKLSLLQEENNNQHTYSNLQKKKLDICYWSETKQIIKFHMAAFMLLKVRFDQ